MTPLSLPIPSDKSGMSSISKDKKDRIIELAALARRILQGSPKGVDQAEISVILDALESVASGMLARSVLNGFNRAIHVLDDTDE